MYTHCTLSHFCIYKLKNKKQKDIQKHTLKNTAKQMNWVLQKKETKVNGYAAKGDHSDLKVFISLFKVGLLLKERICSQGEQILSFKSSPILRRLSCTR